MNVYMCDGCYIGTGLPGWGPRAVMSDPMLQVSGVQRQRDEAVFTSLVPVNGMVTGRCGTFITKGKHQIVGGRPCC